MKILFIKSTSLQHLALSFEKVRELPPPTHPLRPIHRMGAPCPALLEPALSEAEGKEGGGVVIDVLAHSHAIGSLKGFGFINRIINYGHTGNFNPLNVSIKEIRKERYDVVVVPFNNASGAGYENVMAAAVCAGAKQIITCNKAGDTETLDIKKAVFRVIKGYSYYPIALVMTVFLFMLGTIGILFNLGFNILNRKSI